MTGDTHDKIERTPTKGVLDETDKNSNTIKYDKTVVLIRHHFSDRGDVGQIFNAYLMQKISDGVRA